MSTFIRQASVKPAMLGHKGSPSAAIPVAPRSLPYHVLRNSRGSLPVYSDIRNQGSKYLLQVRNIEGDANAMLRDLRATLFPPGSDEAIVFRGQIRAKHLILQGPGRRWKLDLVDWLKTRGF